MKKKIVKIVILFILIIIISFILLILLNHNFMPIYMNYSEGEMKRLVTTVINRSITNELTEGLKADSLFLIKTDNNTGVTMVDFDPVILNRVMGTIANTVYDNLHLVSQRDQYTLKKFNLSDSIFYIPMGVAFSSVILNNLGPRIPINLEIIGSVNPNIETKITEYGINNSLIEVFIHVIVDVKMILPTTSNTMQVVVVVPLAVKIIQGMVPEYYQGNLGSSNFWMSELT